MNGNKVLTGQIIADTVIYDPKSRWGGITGDINDQLDLIEKLSEKEDSDVTKIAAFFSSHPEYGYQFLISMAGKSVESVKWYLQLIIDDKVGNDSLWVPYEVGRLCLVISASGTQLDKAIRFYVPQTGQVGTVNLADESGIVKFIYYTIDEVTEVEWSDIQGSVLDNPELAAALDARVAKEDNITVEEVNSLFDD